MKAGTSRISKAELLLIGGVTLLLILQYPLQTTFPIGGDATRYLLRATAGFPDIFTNSWYPGVIFLLWVTSLFPTSLDHVFIWWVTAGHIATACSLIYLGYRLTSLRAGIFSAFAWSLALVQITRHTEDATLAQLLSLPPLIFVILLTSKQKWLRAITLAVLTYTLHPISALVAFIYIAFSALLVRGTTTFKKFTSFIYTLSATVLGISLALGTLFYLLGSSILFREFTLERYALSNSLLTPFGICILLAIPGSIALVRSRRKKQASIILSFATLSVFLTFNSYMGLGILPQRFVSYFVISIAILAGVGFDFIATRTFTRPLPQVIVALLVLIPAALHQWNSASSIFTFYESPSRYARLHEDERAAIAWMQDTLLATSHIVSSTTNRHSEWIPLLSKHAWTGISSDDPFWHNTQKTYQYTHVVLFKHREKPEELFPVSTTLTPVYENDGAVIYELK